MAEPLFDILRSHLSDDNDGKAIHLKDPVVNRYVSRLANLPIESLDSTELQSLSQASHSALLSLQSLCSRSSKPLIASADHFSSLQTSIPSFTTSARELPSIITSLDAATVSFSEKYSRSSENAVLDRRKRALLMARNVEKVSDILDLPTLLSSTIVPSSAQGSSTATLYNSALDLHSHIKRLHLLYPESVLLNTVYAQAEEVMQEMTSNLVQNLRSQNLKLAPAMRTIGWLRRIAPELDDSSGAARSGSGEGVLGILFLVCRLANLNSMLEALEPLRELADQETQRRKDSPSHLTNGNAWSGGQQTEKYLKRYIEIFREQSFAIISMFKSIFPPASSAVDEDLGAQFRLLGLKSAPPIKTKIAHDPLQPLPSALSTFPLHLTELLNETLTQYLPNVRDKSSRESLLTQVLYCAGSLGRLGGDFSLILAQLEVAGKEGEDAETNNEWIGVVKKHRLMADRLESLASGVENQSRAVREPLRTSTQV
ncbi:hypothetical protein MMC25_007408 [Agyrium rufum]|nr:hypothetical protein [Agyrium rufum]